MNTLDLTTLIPRCHEASKANGWWNPIPNQGQQLMLVVSELAEALEADRSGKQSDPNNLIGLVNTLANCPEYFETRFKANIKDTVGDELADAYIRLCDFAGGFLTGVIPSGQTSVVNLIYYCGYTAPKALPVNFGQALLEITGNVWWAAQGMARLGGSDFKEYGPSMYLGNALGQLQALCQREGIDLATHIDLKLAFNKTRGQKHGGKLY